MANGRLWTKEEIKILEDGYKNDLPREEIAKTLGRNKSAVLNKARVLGFADKYVSKYSKKYKAIYQNYDWLLNEVLAGKNTEEIAKDAKASKRVIEKWVNEKYHISFKDMYKLSDLQRQIIIWGTLGDGHIDKRETQPLYIESHTIDEKDYLFWKYDKLKEIFNSEPIFYKGQEKMFVNNNGKTYQCKDYYRMSSKIVYDLKSIRNMSKIDKINTLDELGLSLYLLDDGNREESNWQLCFAMFNQEEKELFIKLCKERFGLIGWIKNCDDRYMIFDAPSSKKIDDIILSILPMGMDIIQKKIIKHRKDL